jgi:hypothetical protein
MISNNPPPEMAFAMAIDDLYSEAGNFIDGTPIDSQGEADAIGIILSSLKQIVKDADKARKAEKKPHDDAAKAVQAKWTPITDKAERAITAIQKPLTAYLMAQEAVRQADAQRLADAAALAEQQAQQAMQNVSSLADAEQAEQLVKDAKKLTASAKRADSAKSHVASVGRAIGLRTYWKATVTDYSALLAYMKQARPDDLKAMLADYATAQVRCGAKHLPGVLIEEEKRVT